MQMQALKAHRYGTQRRAGDTYEVRAADVRLVKALGWAREATAAEAEAPAQPARYDMATIKAEAKPKRAYRRRDMTAEA